MTNEEAIKELRDASDSEARYGDTEHHYNEVMKRVEAFEMAIKALEQNELNPSYNGVKSELEQTRWIPVSERLPEKQDCYLVTIKWKGSYSGDVYIETNIAVFREKPKEWDCKGVVAWMPLPEPYKAESEE